MEQPKGKEGTEKKGETRGRILLVEDDLFNRRMYARVLTGANYEVHLAANGEEALKLLRANPVDLVVSDIKMPGIDGFGLLRAMRADAQLALIPVIVLTALNQDSDRARGFGLGADAYLTKPIKFETLVAEVEGALLRGAATKAGNVSPALAGRLDAVGPVVVLTLLSSMGKSGEVNFTRAATKASIRIRAGQPVGAAVGSELSGIDAAISIMGWSTGEFTFTEGSGSGAENITVSFNDLLVELSKRR